MKPELLTTTRTILRIVMVLNLLAGLFILVLGIASLVAPAFFFRALGGFPASAHPALAWGMGAIILIGLASVPLVQRILGRLIRIVDSVGLGDPFVPANAVRLREIAWALLWLQLLAMAAGLVAKGVSSRVLPLDIDWNFPWSGWLSVLLLFVLAQVFERGADMRADLEGTV